MRCAVPAWTWCMRWKHAFYVRCWACCRSMAWRQTLRQTSAAVAAAAAALQLPRLCLLMRRTIPFQQRRRQQLQQRPEPAEPRRRRRRSGRWSFSWRCPTAFTACWCMALLSSTALPGTRHRRLPQCKLAMLLQSLVCTLLHVQA